MSPLSRWLQRRRLDADTRVMEALSGYMPNAWRYSYDLMRETGMRSGRFYPTIYRLEAAGVVEAKRDSSEPPAPRYGPRVDRLYRLTTEWRRSLT